MQKRQVSAVPAVELTPREVTTVARRVIGGITLYPDQFTKINAYAKTHGLSRSEIIRQLIDDHL